jgi:hypothetical protein
MKGQKKGGFAMINKLSAATYELLSTRAEQETSEKTVTSATAPLMLIGL